MTILTLRDLPSTPLRLNQENFVDIILDNTFAQFTAIPRSLNVITIPKATNRMTIPKTLNGMVKKIQIAAHFGYILWL